MASASTAILILIILSISSPIRSTASVGDDPIPAPTPTPTPWPHQFHALLLMNNSRGSLQLNDLWYDWTNGRNFNILRDQLASSPLYDLEWNNGTSFYYRLDSTRECRPRHFEVGILSPNWLDGATYLGQRRVNGFLCNVWTKVDFIVYYEDVATKWPVYWVFFTGMEANVMTFEEGAVLEDAKWQAPEYCFDKEGSTEGLNMEFDITGKDRESLLHGALRGSIER